jgi:hypothetical protein
MGVTQYKKLDYLKWKAGPVHTPTQFAIDCGLSLHKFDYLLWQSRHWNPASPFIGYCEAGFIVEKIFVV